MPDQEIKTYRDSSIQVNENGYFLTVLHGETITATTLRSLEDKIDDLLRADAKQLTIDLAVLDGEGSPCRIVGINLGSGKVLTRPPGTKGPFVPASGDNQTLIKDHAQIEMERHRLSTKIRDRSIKENFAYGRITSDQ